MSRLSQLEQALRTERFVAIQPTGEACDRLQLQKRLLLLQRTALPADTDLHTALAGQKALQLTQADANLLYFCDELFTLCQLKAEIDPALLQRFMGLRPVVASILLEEGVAGLAQHPLVALLDRLWYASLYWMPSLGKDGEKYKARLDDLLQRILVTNPARAPYADWLEEFAEQLDRDFQRAERLTQRISQAERERWIRSQSRQIVQHNVNRVLQYAEMPEVIEQLLKGPWANSLQQVLLQQGIESTAWHNLLRLAEYLLDSVQPPETEKERQRLYKLVPRIPGMLRKQIVSLSAEEIEQWITGIEQAHLQLMTGQALPLQAACPLAVEVDSGVSTSVNSSLVAQVARIPEGQWLVYGTEDQALLCRLAIKLEEAGQLLFVNVFGARIMQKSFAEFAYLLASRHVHLLNTDTNFTQCVRDTIDQFLLMHRFHELLKLDALAWQQQEQQRQEREARRRQLAEAKAREEAAARERARQEAARRERLLQVEQAMDANREQVATAIATLAVGAWLDLPVAGNRMRCKLAAILGGGQRYLFTDRQGNKLAEYTSDEIRTAILEGNARIIDSGQRFGQSLETIIKTLRAP